MRSKISRFMAALLTLALIVTSVNVAPLTVQAATAKNVTKVQITKPDTSVLVLKKGKTYKLKAGVLPKNAKNKKVTYKTSKKSVVAVSSSGTLKAKKNGTAKITVTSKQNKKKKATLKVIVGQPVTKVTISGNSSVEVGGTVTLKAAVAPAKASYKTVTWKSSDESVAKVSAAGTVTAVKAGKAAITATAADGSAKKAGVTVTVTEKAQDDTQTPTPTPTPDPTPTPTPDPTPTPTPAPATAALSALRVVNAPETVWYRTGSTADITGLTVEAVYSDDTTKVVAMDNCNVTLGGEDESVSDAITTALTPAHKYIVVSYTEGDVTVTAKQAITVEDTPAVKEIKIITAPKTEYVEGDVFDASGMKVEITYESALDAQGTVTETVEDVSKDDRFSWTDRELIAGSYTLNVHYKWNEVDTEIPVTLTVNKKITAITADTTAVEVAAGSTEASVKAELAKIKLTADDGTVLTNKAAAWTIEGYTADKAGDYTATLDAARLTAPDGFAFASDIKAVTVKVTVKNMVTAIKADKTSVDVTTGTTEADVKELLAKIKLTTNDGTELANTTEAWTIKDYAADKAGDYTATLDVSRLTAPEGSVFADDIKAVTVKISVKKKLTAVKAALTAIEVATGSSEAEVKASLAKIELTADGTALTNAAEAWTIKDYAADKAGDYTATLDVSRLAVPDGCVFADDIAAVTVTVTVKKITITKLEVSEDTINVYFGDSEASILEKLAALELTANDVNVLTNSKELWTVEKYDAETAGTYTATLDTSRLTFGDGYELAADLAAVTVKVVVGELTGITIDTAPAKVRYAEGDSFDTTGMKVTASYSNELTKDVTDDVEIPEEAFAIGTTSVTVSYTEGKITKTAAQAVTVLSKIDALKESAIAHYTFDDTLANDKADGKSASMEKWHMGGASDTAATYEAGVKGKAVRTLGEKTDGIKLDATLSQADYTISLWVKPYDLKSKYSPVLYAGKNADSGLNWFSCYNSPDTFLLRSVGNGWGNKKESDGIIDALIVGKWSMMTLAMKGDQATMYVNGKVAWEGTLEEYFVAQKNAPIYLATCGYDSTFDGAYDEVSIYGQTLTAEQVSLLYEDSRVGVTGFDVSESKISVEADATEDDVKEALAELTITAVAETADVPEIENDKDWTLAEAEKGYTATRTITLPDGFIYAPDAEKTVTVQVIRKDANAVPSSLAVKTAPTKTKYYAGDTFDAAGLELTVTYTDDHEVTITKDTEGFAVDAKALTADDTSVKVSYTETVEEKDTTVSVEVPVNVYDKQTITYSFDDSLDSDKSGVSATLYAAGLKDGSSLKTSYVDGVKGKAVSMVPTAGYELGTIPAGCGDLTISFWLKSSTTGQWNPVTSLTPNKFNSTGQENWFGVAADQNGIVKGNDQVTGNGRYEFDKKASNKALSGQWEYVTVVVDGQKAGSKTGFVKGTMYVNGEVYASGNICAAAITDNTQVYMGVNIWGDNGITGAVDDYKYANYAWTAEEVKAAYNSYEKVTTATAVTAEKSKIQVDAGTEEADVKEALGALALTGVNAFGKAVPVKNSADAWTIADYAKDSIGTYTATLNMSDVTTEDGYSISSDVEDITVEVEVCGKFEGIEVTTQPTKTVYVEGEKFNTAGMVVTANYEGGTTEDVTKAVTTDVADEALTTDITKVTVSFVKTVDGESTTVTKEIPITVLERQKVTYSFEESLASDTDGVSATAYAKALADGSSVTTAYEDGIKGKAITMKAAAGYCLGTLPKGSGSMTISFWMKSSASSENCTVTAVTPNHFNDNKIEQWLGISPKNVGGNVWGNDAVVGMSYYQFTKKASDKLLNGEWKYVTIVADANQQGGTKGSISGTMYVNGEVYATGDIAVKTISDNTQVYMGVNRWDDGIDGAIDEYSYTNYASTADEVKAAYEAYTADSTDSTEAE